MTQVAQQQTAQTACLVALPQQVAVVAVRLATAVETMVPLVVAVAALEALIQVSQQVQVVLAQKIKETAEVLVCL
jgi:hypothetical protein